MLFRSDAYSFVFEKPSNFEFLPGQYIKMFMNIKDPDSRGVSRYFTIAASPTEKNLMITTRIGKSVFKQKLGSLPIGSRVEMRGPFGTFVLNKDTRPRVFLAGGIGITPARSMMIYANDKKLNIPITLIVSFSRKEDIIFHDDLAGSENKNLKAIFLTERINEETIKKHVGNLRSSIFYITGPTSFVEAMEKLIKSLEVAEENIKTEDFPGY